MKKYFCVKYYNRGIFCYEYIHNVKKIKYDINDDMIKLKMKDNSYRFIMPYDELSFTVCIEDYIKE